VAEKLTVTKRRVAWLAARLCLSRSHPSEPGFRRRCCARRIFVVL